MLKRSGSAAPILMFDEVGLDKFEVLLNARCVASQKVHEAFPGGHRWAGPKGSSYTSSQLDRLPLMLPNEGAFCVKPHFGWLQVQLGSVLAMSSHLSFTLVWTPWLPLSPAGGGILREAALAVPLGRRLSDLFCPPMSCLALDGFSANDPP